MSREIKAAATLLRVQVHTVHAFAGSVRRRRVSWRRGQNLVQGLRAQGAEELQAEVSCAELCHGLAEGGADLQHGCESDGGVTVRDVRAKAATITRRRNDRIKINTWMKKQFDRRFYLAHGTLEERI